MRTVPEQLARLYAARIGYRVQPRDTLQRWTRATKEILTDFAGEHGWQAICTGVRNHEYLLDFIAVDPNTADVQLAVETEWGSLGSVVHDFRKLLYIKSDLKIMICGSGAGGDRLCAQLETLASRYPRHVAGEMYVILDVNEADMAIRSYVWIADADGKASVHFQPFMEDLAFGFAATAAS